MYCSPRQFYSIFFLWAILLLLFVQVARGDDAVLVAEARPRRTARTPVEGARPHKLSVVSIEKQTSSQRVDGKLSHVVSKRIVLDIEPPIAPYERYEFDCLIRPNCSSFSIRATALLSDSMPYVSGPNGQLTLASPYATAGCGESFLRGGPFPIHSLEILVSPLDTASLELACFKLNGKTLIGEPPKPPEDPAPEQPAHKVKLVKLEDYTFKTRKFPGRRHGKRAVFDFDPPIAPDETFRLSLNIDVGSGSRQCQWEPFDEWGELVVTGSYAWDRSDDLLIERPPQPVYGVQMIVSRAPGHKGEEPPLDPRIYLDGKLVYGKASKP